MMHNCIEDEGHLMTMAITGAHKLLMIREERS